MTEQRTLVDLPWAGDENLFGELTDKQWKILKAALKVFTEKGYSAATTSEIAREAGVAEGTIFRHFKTKKDILLATLIPLMKNFIGPGAANSLQYLLLANDTLPVEEVLFLILADRQKLIAPNLPLLRVVIIEANFHPELKDVLIHSVAARVQNVLLAFLQQRQKKGELRDDLDPWTMLRSLFGAFVFYLISRSFFPEREEGRDNLQELKKFVDLFLQGAKSKAE